MIPDVVGDGGRLVGLVSYFQVCLKKAGSRFRSAASQTSGAIDSSGKSAKNEDLRTFF